MAAKKTGRLSRADVQKIVDGLSTRDLFSVARTEEDASAVKGAEIAADIFDHGAERQGWGPNALDRVPLADGPWVMELLSESLNVGTPKAEDGLESLASADTGD